MKATEQLKKEHNLIRLAMVLLEATKNNNIEDAEKLLDFFTNFTDKCHHGKEEGILFPALEEAGIPKEGGPIQVMLYEHEIGRNLLRQIKEYIQSLKIKQDELYKERISQTITNYVKLLEEHIQKENNVLFVMANIHLSEETQYELFDKFEEFEIKEIGRGKHEEYHKLIEEIKEKVFGKSKILDVRDVEPVQRHGIIFGEFEKLNEGESFILINDHDPKPLFYQFQAEKEGKFKWEYVLSGPIIWCVKLTKQA
jgi:hemerythrin-like domain-containing protein/uncharacterized protein (DUF2249 family)